MELARVIYRDIPWYLSDGPLINPEVGTIVQYEIVSIKSYEVYFPGCVGVKELSIRVFSLFFEFL